MTPEQIDMVQESFAKVVPIKAQAADIFYTRLFQIAPQVRPLFRSDMGEQGMKLMTTLGVVVNGLRDLPAIVPVAQKLAVEHRAYGVEADHYDAVGAALLYTLETGLGDDFTADVETAWATAYDTLAGVMKQAAYPTAAE